MYSDCTIDLYVLSSFFFFKQKTAYEMRISDWSSDVCSSDLIATAPQLDPGLRRGSRSTPYFSPSSIPLQTTSRSLTAATDLSKPALASPFKDRKSAE